MTVAESPWCANTPCSRQVPPRATGRPGRYCSATCRQSAYRERVRQVERAARHAEDLAAARAELARLWPELETASEDVSEGAGAVLAYAAVEDEADRGALEYKLAEFRADVDQLERLALAFRRADERAAALTAERARPGE